MVNFNDRLNCFKATDGSFYQPTVYDLEAVPGQVTVNVVDVDGVPEFSLDGLVWQDSNVFSDLAAGEYTVYVRSKVNLMKTFKTTTI